MRPLALFFLAYLTAPAVAQSSLLSNQHLLRKERRIERRQQARQQYPELVKKLQNPLSRLTSIPISFEFTDGIGSAQNGESFALRIAPRVPFSINDNWHVISKTDIAWVSQKNIVANSQQEGFNNLAQTFFFSPNRPLNWEVYWGLGPTIVLPTAQHKLLGDDHISIGPSFAVYKQANSWTSGILFNHLWSITSGSDDQQINNSRLEPLIAYTTKTATTLALSAEINRNWQSNQWVTPLKLRLSQLTMIRKRPIQWTIGAKHFISSAPNTPQWAGFFQITLPLPAPFSRSKSTRL